MAQTIIEGIKVSGISAAVPRAKIPMEPYYETFGREEVEKLIANTGILERRSDPALCTSDLCFAAAEGLLAELGWERSSIDLLIFLSQTPDYSLPATACCLHGRLGLSRECSAFDINLGCSGYPYGIWTAATMMKGGAAKRCLLLVGETGNRDISPRDRGTALLFGDAGTATALELSADAPPMYFLTGSDGSGWDVIIRRAGGQRLPQTPERMQRIERDNGNFRAETDTFMNGPDVFSFTIREVPTLLRRTLDLAGWTQEGTDSFVLHQANKFILQHLAKKVKIPAEKLPMSLNEFGNTSSASIPLTLVRHLRQTRTETVKALLAGFGVGLSWSSAAIQLGPLVMPPLIEVDASAAHVTSSPPPS